MHNQSIAVGKRNVRLAR